MHPSRFLKFAAYLGLTHGACETNVTISGLGTASDGQPAIDRQIALFSFGGSSCSEFHHIPRLLKHCSNQTYSSQYYSSQFVIITNILFSIYSTNNYLAQDITYSHISIRSSSKSDWYSYYGFPTFDLSAHCDIQSSGVPLREFVQTGHFTWTLIPEQKITNIVCETTPHTLVNFIGRAKDGTQVFRTEKIVGNTELGFRFGECFFLFES